MEVALCRDYYDIIDGSNHSKLIVVLMLPLTLRADFAKNIVLSSYLVLRERCVVAGLRPLASIFSKVVRIVSL